MKKQFDQMKQSWGHPFVARRDVPKFTNGLISTRTLARDDAAGVGPKGGFLLVGKMVYPVESLVEYLENKILKENK